MLDRQTTIARQVLECDRLPDALVKELGDGLMLWFDSPNAALDVLHVDCSTASSRAAPTAASRSPCGSGVHHGDAVARGDDLAGQTINIGARIADLAGPGEILLSDAVVDAGCDRTDLEPIGGAQVKGVESPIWLYRVTLVT